MIEKIAMCCWRMARAVRCEAGLARKRLPAPVNEGLTLAEWRKLPRELRHANEPEEAEDDDEKFDEEQELLEYRKAMAGRKVIEPSFDHLILPLGVQLDRLLRYQTSNQRELAYAISELERLQRARKGEHVPAPASLQVSTDQ